MTKICNLPRDLAEEVLSRVPVTSLRRVRSTCRKWNTLSKDMSFAKKYIAQAKLAAAEGKVMVMDFRVYLMRLNLSAKLIGPDGLDQIDVCKVFHCDGLLLCITKNYTSLVVWNPYLGQTRWIKRPTHGFYGLNKYAYAYALGYNKSSNSHKILRFHLRDFQIYDINSDSWRVLDVPPRDWGTIYHYRCVSVKGNTYWFASKPREYVLICFDFTRETFGLHFPLPFEAMYKDSVSLSSVREEQLAVLFQPLGTLQIEIWVTTKIEPDAVSWSNKVFLSANIKPLIDPKWEFQIVAGFFIDEEKKVAVVFNKEKDIQKTTRNVGYIIGVDGSLKEIDVGESAKEHSTTIVCSYVPSLVQLN